MTTHEERQQLPHSPEQIFALVKDVERYPEFLPWCRAARIIEQHENTMLAELVISFAHITESYISRVSWREPEEISVELVKGPFHHLTNRWHFAPKDGGTEIHFFLDFAFKSKILDKLIGSYYTKATQKMVAAFKTRAEALYGKPDTVRV